MDKLTAIALQELSKSIENIARIMDTRIKALNKRITQLEEDNN